MATARDYTKTSWAASYKGFPFYFERDDDEIGRGVVVHEFPNRDTPFNEDLGAKAVYFSGSAYITGDDVDTRAAAFRALFSAPGPGILVVPLLGPVLVRGLTCKRVSEKDRLGRVAFDVRFVQEGASTALISVPLLNQTAATASATLAAAIVAASTSILAIAGQPEFVAAAAADEVQAGAAMIDAVRTSNPVDVAVSETVAAQIRAIVTAAPLLLDPDGPATADVAALAAVMNTPAPATPAATVAPETGIAAIAGAIVQAAVTLGAGMSPPAARGAMASLIDFYAPETAAAIDDALSANAQTAAQNVLGVHQLVRLAALTAWANALIGVIYTDRPQGVTARAEAAERFEIELNNCPGAAFAGLYIAIEALQGGVVAYLTQLIANLAPVVTVEAATSLPSLVWAWSLYQDPTRGVDLALRNGVRHPSFMPQTFDALAPGYKAPGILTAWPAPPL